MKTLARILLLCTITLATFFATTPAHAAPNIKQRSVGRLPTERHEPLRLRSVRVKGKKVFNKLKFDDDRNWLKDLTVHVKNVSGKRILFASIDLFFSEPGGPHAVDQIEYGNRQLLTRPPTANELGSGIEPQQEVDIRLDGVSYDRVCSLLADVGATDVSRLQIRVGRVIFQDDTIWYAGSLFSRDGTEARFWNLDRMSPSKNAFASATSDRLGGKKFSNLTTNVTLTGHTLPANWNGLFTFNSMILPASYPAASLTPANCYRVLNPQNIWCHLQPGCTHRKDYTDMIAGNYIIVSDQTSCTDNVSGNYCGLDSTTVAVQCVFGGGGGGGLEDFNNGYGESCSSDWDCDFGYTCDWGTNTCQ